MASVVGHKTAKGTIECVRKGSNGNCVGSFDYPSVSRECVQ